MLCSACRRILSLSKEEQFYPGKGWCIPHHYTFQGLKQAIDLGCYPCNRLWAIVEPRKRQAFLSLAEASPGPDHDVAKPENKGSFLTSADVHDGIAKKHPGCYYLSLSINVGVVRSEDVVDLGNERRCAIIMLRPAEEPHANTIESKLTQNTTSVETLTLAKKWISDCLAGHDKCNEASRSARWYPTRLIDCGSLQDSEPHVRLVETSAAGIEEPYLTLSHCWGKKGCLKVTTDTYSQFLDEIPASLLPILYKDAMQVTRGMGFRYLWIDSLCIIQQGDSKRDWHHESALMGNIYSRSICNISAADAPDSHTSLFRPRNPNLVDTKCAVEVNIRGTTGLWRMSDLRFWETEVGTAVINTRGWVLQERLLSPRTLYLGERQALWECCEKDAAEIYPDGLTREVNPPETRPKDILTGCQSVSSGTGGKPEQYRLWGSIVKTYTSCGLSFPGDKLIAVSAVAKAMSGVLKDEYVAGMWRRNLELELIWMVAQNSTVPRIPSATYRAPSWSWASANGTIQSIGPTWSPHGWDYKLLIEVEDVHLDHETEENKGAVRGGWLRLWGVLGRLELIPNQTATNGAVYGNWDTVANGAHISVTQETLFRIPSPVVYLDAMHKNFDEENASGSLYFMPAGTSATKRQPHNTHVLLLELIDADKGVFRRIGYAVGHDLDMQEKLLARNSDESSFPCQEYRDGKHLIRII